MKVLHLPTTVGGNPQGLSRALRRLGVDSWSLTYRLNYLGYPADEVLWDKSDSGVRAELKRVRMLLKILKEYDVVHFNWGCTLFSPPVFWKPGDPLLRNLRRTLYSTYLHFFQLLELNLLRFRGIPAFVHYQGSDARQDDVCLKTFAITAATQIEPDPSSRFEDHNKRAQIRRLSRYCEKMYSVNPDLLHVLPESAEFVPYCHISLEEWRPNYTQSHSGPLRIGHAPSNRRIKGTELVLEALGELESDGYAFELVLVEGVSHAEAKKKYETIDVLVDQLFIGWYGGLALECMALGKPVLVYIRDEDLKFIPDEMAKELPIIQVEPTTIRDVLRSVLEMPRRELLEIGQRSRRFAERWHDPDRIATKIHDDYLSALRVSRDD